MSAHIYSAIFIVLCCYKFPAPKWHSGH